MTETLRDNQPTAKPATDEIATASKDIDIFAGYFSRLENPDPVLRTESGGKGIRLYDEVARDPHASSVLQSRYLSVVGKEWEIEPGASGPDGQTTDSDEEIASFVSGVLDGCNFDQARMELLHAVLYGYRVAEVMWKYDELGRVAIAKIRGKHPRRFAFTPERELRLITRQNMIEGEPVPERKFVVFSYGDSDNPYGCGLGRILWWPVWFKKHGVKFWLVFLEKFGQPTPVGKYPPGTLKDKQDELLKAIELIHVETGIIIPENMAIELLEAARTGQVSYMEMCEYMDRAISKGVLSQTLTTEVGAAGSYAASQTHSDVKQEITDADADLLDEALNESLIRWIVDYNYPGVVSYPKIRTHSAPKPDLKQRSEIDRTLVREIGLPVSRQYFYDTYVIPSPAEGEELVSGPQTPYAGLGASGWAGGHSGFSERRLGVGSAPQTVRMYTEQLEGAAGKHLDSMIDRVRDMVRSATSFEEIRDGLLDLYPEMDALELGELMQQAFTAAELAGRYDVKEGE